MEPYPDAQALVPPVVAYQAYTRFVPILPLLTKPQGAVALLVLVTPNVSVHALMRTGMSVSFQERVNASQVSGLLLPGDSSTLNPVLRTGLYLRGKPMGTSKTTQYGLVQHVVRRPLGVEGSGAFHSVHQVAFSGGLVKTGILQAGLGETGFQVWPQSDKGRWIPSAKNGHLVLGGQRRRLVVDRNQLLGD
jgi:hypothetical protein